MSIAFLAFYNAVTSFIRLLLTNLSGGRLTRHLRKQLFYSIIDRPVAWFDDERHSLGLFD